MVAYLLEDSLSIKDVWCKKAKWIINRDNNGQYGLGNNKGQSKVGFANALKIMNELVPTVDDATTNIKVFSVLPFYPFNVFLAWQLTQGTVADVNYRDSIVSVVTKTCLFLERLLARRAAWWRSG